RLRAARRPSTLVRMVSWTPEANSRQCRSPWPSDRHRLIVTVRPRRHRHADGGKRLEPERPKLKMGALWNSEANAWVDIDHRRVALVLSPHLATARQEVPNLLHRSVRHGLGSLIRPKFEMRHSATGQSEEDSDVRSVGRHVGALRW